MARGLLNKAPIRAKPKRPAKTMARKPAKPKAITKARGGGGTKSKARTWMICIYLLFMALILLSIILGFAFVFFRTEHVTIEYKDYPSDMRYPKRADRAK